MRKISILIISFFVIAFIPLNAQNSFTKKTVNDTIPINLDNIYKLSQNNIIEGSETVLLKGFPLNKSDYNLNYRTATFSLSDSLEYSLFDTLFITYQTIIIPIKNKYSRRSLVVRYEENMSDSIRVIKSDLAPLSSESIFGEGINRSGSISRGFTVGSNQDLKVNSGMRLQFSGKLSDDLEIIAALTDQNTPIQPEGTTERLEELDQVFIKVKHPNAAATFGDFEMKSNVGEFGKISRKMQGLEGEVFLGNTTGKGILAGSRGKFNTNQLLGSDGNQGPYRLSGINNEQAIIVVAGTETIYIDGEKLNRGENNDYVIDYSLAEITFTTNKLITSASRITVDFEYIDRQYERNLIGGNATTKFFSDKLKLSFNYFSEGDDENNPIDLILSDEDKQVLENAGDDRYNAVKSGVTIASEDSSGRRVGTYTKIDTLINSEAYTYYYYDPGADNSIYNVTYSYVGNGQGDYQRISVGNFEFVGIGEGDYLPIKFLPLAQQKQLGNFVIEATPWENLTMSFEIAGSFFDKNKFSNIDNDDNFGRAHNLALILDRSEIDLGALSLGLVGLTYRERYVQDRFTTLDRYNTVEYNRDYNITDTSPQNETLREAKLFLQPIDELTADLNYGFLKRGSLFQSDRYFGDIKHNEPKKFNASYNYDYVNTSDLNSSSKWFKQNASASYLLGKFEPGIDFLYDDKNRWKGNSDSLSNDSHKFSEIGAFLNVINISGLNLNTRVSSRDEFFPLNGMMEKESNSLLQSFFLKYSGIRELNLSFNVTLRDKNITEVFQQTGRTDNKSVLIRSLNKLRFWKNFITGDLFYEASTQSSAKLEKVFVRVHKGEGNYSYLGDLNNNGIADEEEFIPDPYDGDYITIQLPTSELFPVINLKTSTRWKVNFASILKNSRTFWSTILKSLSTETLLRLDEYTEESDIASVLLLKPSILMNDSTTLRGANSIQQDFFLFKNKPDLSFRFRYMENNRFTKYNSGDERSNLIERSLRIRFRMVKEISNQTDFINQTDNVASEINANRARLLSINNLISDFSYRPIQSIEVGFKFNFGRSIDNLPDNPTILDNNSQLLRFTFSFANKGRLRLEAERNEITDNGTENDIPFEMLRGNVIGNNYFWRVNFDYRIAKNLQVTLNYNGRKQGEGNIVHNMRSEARAYF
ncbi:MAG: hypothetical protein ABFS12_05545 [Bacteroidota bacterium]